jgi:hypothetical protein
MLEIRSGVETAHLLLKPDRQLPENLFGNLRELGRRDLSLEYFVVMPKYRSLFSDDELAIAQWRLDKEN